jgi:type II secretory pathway component GspD/PulD (secretin)
LNKRIRSRVLAAGVASSALFGLGALPSLQQSLCAQDKPTAAEQLDRGARLFDQKQYAEAKKVLLDIDPAQLPEDQRTKLTDLMKNTDVELAKSQGANGSFDSAQANLDGDKLAAAASGFQGVIDDTTASSDLKDKAKIQLALVKQKQADKAPQMKELLAQADALYQAGKLDEAQNAVGTVIATGSDLGWQDNAKPAQLEQKIADRRAAMASGASNGTTPVAVNPADATPTTNPAVISAAENTPEAKPNATPNTTPTTMASDMAAPATMASDMAAPGAMAGTPVAVAPPVIAPTPAVDPNSALGQTISADEIERQRALTLYNISMKQSSDALTANPPQYPAAIEAAHQAATVIDDNRRYFSDVEASALTSAASRQEQMATTNKGTYDAQVQQREQALAKAAEQDLALKRANEKRVRVDALMRDAQRFVDTQQYKEGADTLRQILIIDPTNSSAKLMLSLVTDRIAYRQYESVVHDASRETVKGEIQNAEEIVPYADLLVYPENWVDLTRTRLGAGDEQQSPADRLTNQKLDENFKEISADQLGLERVLDFLRDNTGTNMLVNWKALGDAGVDRNAPISVKLRDVPFRRVLSQVLAAVGGTAQLDFAVEDGIIVISTKDDLAASSPPKVVTYDISDLLVQPDNKIPPNLDPSAVASAAGTGGGSGGTSIFNTNAATNTEPNAATQTIVDSIEKAIQSTVAPESWITNGGSVGSIQEFSNVLLIRQSVENHRQIDTILNQLRETHSIQIAVEARIMFVDNNFFDQFGFNWGLTIPAGSLGGNVGAITASSGSLASVNQLSASGALASTVAANPSLTVNGSILDNFQLSLILQATQADQRTVTVSSPRITLFNGQSGFISVGNRQAYIANFNQTLTPGTGFGGAAVSTTLTPAILPTGITLNIHAAVSADRRYVIMQVDPQLATNNGFTDIGSMNAAAASTSNTLAGVFLQLPNVDTTEVDTTVSVPDGGTLLVGGEKVISTSDVEVGVPILSKIPGINRLFTNRATEKDERTLLILIRPKIIIEKEIENNLYGPGYDRPTGLPTNSTNQSMLDGNGVDPGFRASGR